MQKVLQILLAANIVVSGRKLLASFPDRYTKLGVTLVRLYVNSALAWLKLAVTLLVTRRMWRWL